MGIRQVVVLVEEIAGAREALPPLVALAAVLFLPDRGRGRRVRASFGRNAARREVRGSQGRLGPIFILIQS